MRFYLRIKRGLSDLVMRAFRFATEHRKQAVVFALLFFIGTVLCVGPARAQFGSSTPDGFFNTILEAISWMLLKLANICMGLTVFGLKFFIELARYNGFIDAPPVIIGWVMIRDLANMFFIVVLLVIAFGTILGSENYEWKKMLGKLVMAAIFINFSKLIAQLIIDIAHVFTITFLNAVSATAGGNLINMFHLQGMMKMLSVDPATAGTTNIRLDIFAASVLALVFSALAMATIFAYVVVMATRVVVLWVLMILAPLAYILGVIPEGKSYADEYWQTFTKQVIVAPIMVFFLWLSFATLGNGTIAEQIGINMSTGGNLASGIVSQSAANPSTSILEVTTWENMASFIIAIAFMVVGLETVQKLGVRGSGFVGSATSFAKNVATYASGFAAARWAAGGIQQGATAAVKGVGKGLYIATLDNSVQRVKNWGERQVEGYRSWRAQGPRTRMVMKDEAVKMKEGEHLSHEEEEKGISVDAEGYKVDADGKRLTKKVASYELETEGQDSRSWLQRKLNERHEKLIQSKKLLEKVTKQKTVREELMDKRVTANPSHIFQAFEGGALRLRAPGKDDDASKGLFGWNADKKLSFDALDRMEQGQLEAEKMRSAAKTAEFGAVGKMLTLKADRFKDGRWQSESEAKKRAQREGKKYEPSMYKGTMADQQAVHKEEAARYEAEIERIQERALNKARTSSKGARALEAKLKAQLEVKALKAESTKVEELAQTSVIKGNIAAAEKLQAELKDGKITEKEAEERAKAMGMKVDHGEVMDTLSRTIAAEKAAHTESKRIETITKAKELEYFAKPGGHGQHELEEEAEFKVLNDTADTVIKRLENEARLKLVRQQVDEDRQTEIENNNLKEQLSQKVASGTMTEAEAKSEFERSKKVSSVTDFQRMLVAQAEGKLSAGQLQSEEETALNRTNTEILDSATNADREASRIEAQAREQFQSDASKTLRKESQNYRQQAMTLANEAQVERNNRTAKRATLVSNIASTTDEGEKLRLQNELAAYDIETDESIRAIEKKNKPEINRLMELASGLDEKAEANEDSGLTDAQKEQKQNLLNKAAKLREESLGWQYGVSKAKAVQAAKKYGVSHATVLSESDQRTVWDIRGIDTPTTAGTEQIEQEIKEFSAMTYNKFMDSVRGYMAKMIELREKGQEPDESTRLAGMSMFRHGINKGWIDDMIISTMNGEKTKKMAKKELGWKNNTFEPRKINHLTALAASGMDFEFAGLHDSIGELLDVGTQDLGMSSADVYKAIDEGKFTDKNGNDITDEVRNKFTKNEDGTNNEDGLRRWNKIFHEDNLTLSTEYRDKLRKQALEKYMDVSKKNQAALQYAAGLRDELVETTHPENGGAAEGSRFRGEQLFLLLGSRMQGETWTGEVNKLPLSVRIKIHPHATAEVMSENHGVVLVRDEKKFRIIRTGSTDVRARSGTSPRFVNEAGALGAGDNKVDFQDENGQYVVAGRNNKTGQAARVQLAWEEEEPGEYFPPDYFDDVKITEDAKKNGKSPDQIRRGRVVSLIMKHDFAKQMRGNSADFLMNMAELSGIDPGKAQSEGIMNAVFTTFDGQELSVKTINQLIEYYNQGKFSPDGKPPDDHIQYYNNSRGKNDRRGGEGSGTPSTPSTPSNSPSGTGGQSKNQQRKNRHKKNK